MFIITTIKENVFIILSELSNDKVACITRSIVVNLYKKKYNHDLVLGTATVYLSAYRNLHNIKKIFIPHNNTIRKRCMDFLSNNSDKRNLYEIEMLFTDASSTYLQNILSEFIKINHLKKESGMFGYKNKYLKYLKLFISEYCHINEVYSIEQILLIKCFNGYLKKQNIKTLDKSYLTYIMHILGYETNKKYHTIKYKGLYMKTEGLLFINNNTLDQEITHRRIDIISSIKENKNITGPEACKVMSCNLVVNKTTELITLYNKDNNPEMNLKNVVYTIKEIEKILFKINIYKKPSIKIATAIYIVSGLAQKKTAYMTGCTTGRIRFLLKLLYNNSDSNKLFKYSSEKAKNILDKIKNKLSISK